MLLLVRHLLLEAMHLFLVASCFFVHGVLVFFLVFPLASVARFLAPQRVSDGEGVCMYCGTQTNTQAQVGLRAYIHRKLKTNTLCGSTNL